MKKVGSRTVLALCIPLCLLMARPGEATLITVDFNSGWDSEINRWTQFEYIGSPVGLGRVSEGGLDGTDALQPGRNAALVYPTSFSSTVSSWQTGVFMRYQTPTGTGGANPMLVIGALGGTEQGGGTFNMTTSNAGSEGNMYGFRAALYYPANPSANPGVVNLRLLNVIIGGQGAQANSDPTSSEDENLLVAGNWYYIGMEVDFNDETDQYNITASLYNATSSGVITGNSILSVSQVNQSNAAFLANDTGVHNFISGNEFGNSGNAAMDNLLVTIPEPGTLTLVIVGFLGALAARRRLRA